MALAQTWAVKFHRSLLSCQKPTLIKSEEKDKDEKGNSHADARTTG